MLCLVMKAVSGGLVISLLLAVASDGQTGGGTWQTLAPMPAARQELASAVLNGKIYVIAGYDEDGTSTDHGGRLQSGHEHLGFSAADSDRNNHNNAAVAAGKLYTFGGRLERNVSSMIR